ncbi:MAG: primosomal protein N', partial [Flavobacteriia bacterium]
MPIPLQKLFTYKITQAEAGYLQTGMRVAVPFGKSKIFTGLVYKIHQNKPGAYEAKEIFQILDEKPLITLKQLEHWEWIAKYYMCSLGEVLRAGIPSSFLLESETLIVKNKAFADEKALDNEEFLIYEALEYQDKIKIEEVYKILGKKNVFPVIQSLLNKKVIYTKEELYEQYKPKLVKYIRLNESYNDDKSLNELIKTLQRAEKQRKVILTYFHLKATKEHINRSTLKKESGVSDAVIKALIDKEIFEVYHLQKDRVSFDTQILPLKNLNEVQETAYAEINDAFKDKSVTLLHGITSSGKTEIYSKLIKEVIESGKQVLYLLPEIALTTQIISRLQKYFGNKITVFHSRYSLNERVEAWNNMIAQK